MPKSDHEKLAAFIKQMLKGRKLTELPQLFGALSDLTRMRLMDLLLTKGQLTVGELMTELGLAQNTASHHLGLLRRHGLVTGVRSSRNILYSVTK